MSPSVALTADQLARHCDPEGLGFATTAELPEQTHIVGQERALEAVDFAMAMTGHGYNVFAMGPEGTGKTTAIRAVLDREAAERPPADDWCYIHDFDDPRRPRALRLPPGRGGELKRRMAALVRELAATIPAALESDEYRGRRHALEEAFEGRRDAAMRAFDERAEAAGIAVVRTPLGIGMAPQRDGKVLGSEAFEALPEAERTAVRATIAGLEHELSDLLAKVPRWEREHRREVEALNATVVRGAVDHLIAEVREAFADVPAVRAYLDSVETDIVARADEVLASRAGADEAGSGGAGPADGAAVFKRCTVNLIVDHTGETCAPVVYEDLPTQPNLLGRIEHVAHLGTLLTDFTLIKAGALHRANGGFLVLDVRRLLGQPFAWDELKRALRARELRLDGLPQAMPWMTTASIEPEPIPLDVKVVLVGDRMLFYLLGQLDPDVAELFRVQADFNDHVARTPETERALAGALATIAGREALLPLDPGAVAAVVDHAARDAARADRLSTNMRGLTDLCREADRLARDGEPSATVIGRRHVLAAIEGRRRRAGRLAESSREAMVRGLVRVEPDGCVIGPVNGLSVVELGDGTFGWPTRITARVRLGRGDVVDIEREVELGGPIHSKGVLILAGFLGGRFGRCEPLALEATLVFEQSYGQVEGDSASMAELAALLSAIGDVPIDQALAITGSVDQLGRSQAVGGVDTKIEGFFDLCAARGLTGAQGVLIPSAVLGTLMLRDDVVDAVAGGRFRVVSFETVDDAMEQLSGLPAGIAGPDGSYPPDSVNGRVASRLAAMAASAREAAGDAGALADRSPVGP